MSEVPSQLAKINDDTLEAKLLIAPMEFSSGARWFALRNNEPAEVESFRWIDMQASGLTDLGAAFKLLNEKLTTKEKGGWMEGRGGAAPVLILISDGGPTDEYVSELKKLKQRGWFNAAIRFAVAVGPGSDKYVLAEIIGNMEAVIDTEGIRNDLASIIKAVIRSASQTASKSASMSGSSNKNNVVQQSGDQINQEVQKEAIENTKAALNLNNTDECFDVS
jgi:uncharacterized protein YegL